jgi:DNA-binding transcriptional regulator YiaG
MMTDEQKVKAAELKTGIEATSTREGAPRKLRAEVVGLKRELQREGTTARELAAALGVHESTLCRWERDLGSAPRAAASKSKRSRGAASFRMVEVTSPGAMPTSASLGGMSASVLGAHGLRVAHAPSGLVVDGLDIETLAALLRRMT